jgi:hypothetical protein
VRAPARDRRRGRALVGGFCTTYFSWRWVFAGEVVVVLAILLLTRRIATRRSREAAARPGRIGALRAGLGLLVFGVLRSASGAGSMPKPDGPSWAGSVADRLARARRPVRDLGLLPLASAARGNRQGALVRPGMLRNSSSTGG